MSGEEFTVTFGKIAWTLEYRDADRDLEFTLDLSPGEPKMLWLAHHDPAERDARYDRAFERCRLYLESRRGPGLRLAQP